MDKARFTTNEKQRILRFADFGRMRWSLNVHEMQCRVQKNGSKVKVPASVKGVKGRQRKADCRTYGSGQPVDTACEKTFGRMGTFLTALLRRMLDVCARWDVRDGRSSIRTTALAVEISGKGQTGCRKRERLDVETQTDVRLGCQIFNGCPYKRR